VIVYHKYHLICFVYRKPAWLLPFCSFASIGNISILL
jgi:hypothetical protein